MVTSKTRESLPAPRRTFWQKVRLWVGGLGIGGLVLVGAQELVKVVVEGYKPKILAFISGQPVPNSDVEGNWEGAYISPKQVDVPPRAEADLDKVPHEPGTQSWAIVNHGERLTVDVSELSNTGKGSRVWEVSGFLKFDSLVASLRGRKIGRGVIYLERNNKWGYYRGYAYLCDCQSPVVEAVMVCPYVLYKSGDISQRSQALADPMVATGQKCTPAKSPMPIVATTAPAAPTGFAAATPLLAPLVSASPASAARP